MGVVRGSHFFCPSLPFRCRRCSRCVLLPIYVLLLFVRADVRLICCRYRALESIGWRKKSRFGSPKCTH